MENQQYTLFKIFVVVFVQRFQDGKSAALFNHGIS